MLKKIFFVLLAITAFLLVTVAGILLYANIEPGKRHLSRIATALLDRTVVLEGGIGLRAAWPPTLYVSKMQIENYEGGRAEQMLDIGLLEISISPAPLFVGDLIFPRIMLKDSTVSLERTPEGDANRSLGRKKPARGNKEPVDLPLIGALDISNSRITYLDPLQNIDIALETTTEGETVKVAGKGKYRGNPFRLDAKGGSLLTVQQDKPYPVDTHISIGHTDIIAKGTVQDPTNFAGMDISLTVKGGNAADLFPIFGIALLPTPPYEVNGQLTYAAAIWQFSKFKGAMGSSDLSGDLKWDRTLERPKLTATFISQKLDFADLGALIGVAPEEAVTEGQKAQAARQAQSPRAIPDVPLDISRLAAMDADVTLTGKSIIAPGWPLDNFFLHVVVDDRILYIAPVKFGTAKGDVSATLTVDSRQQPMFTQADFNFRRLSLGELMAGISAKIKSIRHSEGYIGGAAKLKGRGASLHEMLATSNGSVGIGMEGGQLSNLLVELAGLDLAQSLGFLVTGDKPVPINCVIGHFDVQDGIMNSRALVIDSEDTNIQGKGTIDLKTEGLDLRFVPQPKDISLAALRSPLTVKGTMKSPNIGIEPGNLIARGAAAGALSIGLTPVAGLLALIDAGLGKDSNCTALIKAANADTRDKGEQTLIPKNKTE